MERIIDQLKNPFAGLNQLLERANLTGIDTAGIVEARRKDIEAILAANRIVYQGAQALAQKQLDILRTTMNAARSAVSEGSFRGTPVEIANRQRELLSKAFQMSLAHMRELADIVQNAQAEAFAVVKDQVEADIRDLVARVKGRGKAAGEAKGAATAGGARGKARKTGAKRTAKRSTKSAGAPAARRRATKRKSGKAKAAA
jgi:phasin family protein